MLSCTPKFKSKILNINLALSSDKLASMSSQSKYAVLMPSTILHTIGCGLEK